MVELILFFKLDVLKWDILIFRKSKWVKSKKTEKINKHEIIIKIQ